VFDIKVAPVSTVIGPLTTISPSRLDIEVTSSDGRAQARVTASQTPDEHVDVCAHAVPPLLHVSTELPLQRVSPGVQGAAQRPIAQLVEHVER
jgi:hypothetical protein